MDKVLLDTDVLSEILKGKNQNVVHRAKAYLQAFERFTTSTVSILEVVKGFQRMQREPPLQLFLDNLPTFDILALDTNAATIAGRIYGDLERTGQTIGRADPMIAGIAIANRMPLVTGNVAHYERILQLGYPLEMENWHTPTSG